MTIVSPMALDPPVENNEPGRGAAAMPQVPQFPLLRLAAASPVATH